MSRMVEEYKLLSHNSTQDLSKIVSEHLSEGWKLYGSPSALYSEIGRNAIFFQAVTKEFEQPGAWG